MPGCAKISRHGNLWAAEASNAILEIRANATWASALFRFAEGGVAKLFRDCRWPLRATVSPNPGSFEFCDGPFPYFWISP
jgi:hypothetical protein